VNESHKIFGIILIITSHYDKVIAIDRFAEIWTNRSRNNLVSLTFGKSTCDLGSFLFLVGIICMHCSVLLHSDWKYALKEDFACLDLDFASLINLTSWPPCLTFVTFPP